MLNLHRLATIVSTALPASLAKASPKELVHVLIHHHHVPVSSPFIPPLASPHDFPL